MPQRACAAIPLRPPIRYIEQDPHACGVKVLSKKLAALTIAVVALVAVSAIATLAGRNRDGSVRLQPPDPIAPNVASAITKVVTETSRSGLTPGGRTVVQPPDYYWQASGPCLADPQPRCAIVAVYDYATRKGRNIITTLSANPQVLDVQENVPVALSPEEDRRGYEIAEATVGGRRIIAEGYDRTLSHDFAPAGPSDPCFRDRCVLLDWRDFENDAKPQHTALVNLTTGQVLEATWE